MNVWTNLYPLQSYKYTPFKWNPVAEMVHSLLFSTCTFRQGCTHNIERSSYQTSLEKWKWFFLFPISFHPIKFQIHLCGRQTCKPLANATTELVPVVNVVDFYWSDYMNECPFSLCGRVFCQAVWDWPTYALCWAKEKTIWLLSFIKGCTNELSEFLFDCIQKSLRIDSQTWLALHQICREFKNNAVL